MTEASKLVGYASLAPADGALAATKLVAYALMGPESAGLYASKLVVYVVTGPPPEVGELRILTWAFTLDDHDFLVIQLSSETLVYDFFSEKWYTWGSGIEADGWRAVRGQNWNANLGAIMPGLGGAGQSNVVCGDEETGALYFLDPGLAEDDLFDGTPGQPLFNGANAATIGLAFEDGAKLATAPAGAAANSRDPSNLVALRNALAANDPADALDGLIFDISSTVAGRTITRDALTTIAATARIALEAQSGVDLDAEAVNLIRFQQAFQASGRVMQVASTLFDTLLGIR